MALRDFESFDNLQSSTGAPGSAFQSKGWNWGGNSPRINVTAGRFGTACFQEADNTVWAYKKYDSQQTWIVGFAYLPGNIGFDEIFTFYDEAGGNHQITVTQSSERIQVRRGNWTGTLLATGTTPLLAGVYYYLEFKLTIDNSAGSMIVRVNEVEDINISSIDTQNTANASADRLTLGGFGGGSSRSLFDDLYVLDGTGSAPFNDFLGDCRVSSLLPNGNGNSSQLTGSDGNSTDNYLLVDEAGAASGSDYVESSNVGDKDTYTMADLPSAAGTVHAVKPVMVIEKDDAGTRTAASVIRVSGTEEDSADFALSTTYQWLTDIRETKPGGGSFSVSDVNGMEVGMKVTG